MIGLLMISAVYLSISKLHIYSISTDLTVDRAIGIAALPDPEIPVPSRHWQQNINPRGHQAAQALCAGHCCC